MVLYIMLRCVNFCFCQQNFLIIFVHKTNTVLVVTLRTKSEYPTTTYTTEHHINIQGDKNFWAKVIRVQNISE